MFEGFIEFLILEDTRLGVFIFVMCIMWVFVPIGLILKVDRPMLSSGIYTLGMLSQGLPVLLDLISWRFTFDGTLVNLFFLGLFTWIWHSTGSYRGRMQKKQTL